MGLINWIFDFYQQYRIDQLQRDAAQARTEASVRTPAGAVDAEKLERAVGEMALAVKTLQRMMVEKGALPTSSAPNSSKSTWRTAGPTVVRRSADGAALPG